MLARYFRTYPWKLAIAWLAFLAPFFFLSYRFANWFTGLRPHVPSLVFGWEHTIPFLAWTIVPYWSTDLLYGLSLLFCPTRDELHTHGKRLLAAQILSVTGSLLFPLRFSFQVPQAEGLFGWMFAALHGFDRPFNQAPSLHLSLTVLLWSEYSRRLRGAWLWLMRGWMVLVAISTLTTFQHHFIDLPTGIWVGLLVAVLFPFEKLSAPSPASGDRAKYRIAAYYLVGAALIFAALARFGGAAWLLLWPGGSLLLMGLIYLSGCAGWFRKSGGRIPASVQCLLGPYLLGAWLNWRWWAQREAASDEIANGIRLGRLPRPGEHDRSGIASIVDLTAELSIRPSGIRYRALPMLDRLVPEMAQLNAAVAAIDDLREARPTLVCCALGYSRSAAAVAAWLLASGKAATVDDAIVQIRRGRPRIVLRAADRARLEEWRRLAVSTPAIDQCPENQSELIRVKHSG
ncbi:MAG TPA: phosphatase PAP2/dual specificity phosphatase family protein [Bryobacteraceae bacterium]|nr:phosphatase PAP2/dual specificity phosphatase family protein [Bryobacteraceae bacterium]